MIMSIFLFIPCFIPVFFSGNVNTKFVQLHYFLSQNIGGTNDIVFPLVQKLRGDMFFSVLPLNRSLSTRKQRKILQWCNTQRKEDRTKAVLVTEPLKYCGLCKTQVFNMLFTLILIIEIISTC